MNSTNNVLDNSNHDRNRSNNVGVSFNDHMITINENTREETDEFKDEQF